jgi:predicted alpha/beta-hydrolase family hydrolase
MDESTDPPVHGFLHLPARSSNRGLVLTHGAGSNAQAPFLIALANALAESGWIVLRCDLPYRQKRSFGPPRPGDSARDREGLASAVERLKERVAGTVCMGGHSYGGRQCSMLAADFPGLADGLLLSSYPLHPPSNPTRVRTEHLPRINVPALFVHGTRDPFASSQEIEAARRLIPAQTRIISVEGVGHDLGFSRKVAPQAKNLPALIVEEVHSLFRG